MKLDFLELAAGLEALTRYEKELIAYKEKNPGPNVQLTAEIASVQSFSKKIRDELKARHLPY